VRFSRHAKNKAREIGVTVADAERLISSAIYCDTDLEGRPRFTGCLYGQRIRVVVALDDPDQIVTIHERRV
jgi:hypothetical protein